MASLHQLLSEDGFKRARKPTPKPKNLPKPDNKSIALPIYICHDKKSFDFSSFRRLGGAEFPSSSNNRGMGFNNVNTNEVEIDEVAVKAVISILSGYIGKFLKDDNFREIIREKCFSCLSSNMDNTCSQSEVIENIELGMEKIERLVENTIRRNEEKVKSLSNSIRLLNIVASINSPRSKNGSTCGVPNAYLSACAELYLSIVYKFEKKDRVCARHLLQLFSVSPFLGRTHLLPELWESFFLPHLLHLKVWYVNEVEELSSLQDVEKVSRMKVLTNAYNDRMDTGTKQFAVYYMEWLKTGVAKAPPIPSVSLPSISSKGHSEKRSSGSFNEQSSINKTLYQTVFGPNDKRRTQSMDLKYGNGGGGSSDSWILEEEINMGALEDSVKVGSSQSLKEVHQRSSSQNYFNSRAELWPATNKMDYLRTFSCRNDRAIGYVHESHLAKNGAIIRLATNYQHLPSSDFGDAVATICTSDILIDCEVAIRVVSKAWQDSHGHPVVEASLSQKPAIEGMLEVMFTSKDDEILELAISILAELVSRSEVNRQVLLNSDPQLEVFMRLLRNSSLFLKASVLLYLLKPMAKHLLSMEWIPLVLRVLEFGDQLQTLFTVRCSPHVAALYLLEQLLKGFDTGINIENARKVVSLGGLSMLVQILETGAQDERTNAALFITSCIQADGSCRHYVANNVKTASIVELLVLGNQTESRSIALSLLTELLCLNRRTQATKFLNELKTEGMYLNTMHILLVHLQRAPLEQRPLVAAILLQLDLLGDHRQSSVFREEVLDAIVEALDCKKSNNKVQEQLGRALLLLAGHFSHVGKSSAENWLLKRAGFDEDAGDFLCDDKDMVANEIIQLNEEEATEDWLKKMAMVMLMNGNQRLLTALSESIENGIPCLARASLVTVAWMSGSLQSIQDASLQSLSCSILVPRLLETLNYDRQLEERVLASLSLLMLVKNTDCQSIVSKMDNHFVSLLRNLSLVTWTAEELLAVTMNGSNHLYTDHQIIPIKNEMRKLLG